MTFTQGKCDVCGRTDRVGVASSTLGAMSLAFCSNCIKSDAEPLSMVVATWWSCNGDMADWFMEVTTFKDGKYVQVKDITDYLILKSKELEAEYDQYAIERYKA